MVPAATIACPAPLGRYFGERRIATVELAPGVSTPLRFSDRGTEHMTTRRAAGLFDFSFMACFEISGPGSSAFVERVQTRNLRGMRPGTIAYTLLCRDDGTVINDATVWNHGTGRYTLFTGRRADAEHLKRIADGHDVQLEDASGLRAILAVQGPLALQALCRAFPGHDWGTLGHFRFRAIEFHGGGCDVARIGYSGEAGCEIVVDAGAAPALWQRLAAAGVELGVAECGFEAIDTLRVEAGHILFTRELAARVTPYELGLGRLVAPYADRFIGSRALGALRFAPLRRRLAGLVPDDRDSRLGREPLPAVEVVPSLGAGRAFITSAAMSPVFGRCLGLGFVLPEDRYPGTRVTLQTGGTARVARLPFHDPPKLLPRRGWTLAAP